jgi:hypothetical protein
MDWLTLPALWCRCAAIFRGGELSCRFAAFAVTALLLLSGFLHAGTVGIFTSQKAFDAAAGPTALEDFTIAGGQAALLTGPLNSASNFPAQFGFAPVVPGDVVSGVTFSSPGATAPFIGPQDAKFYVDFGGLAGFQGSFLATYNRGGPPQPLTASFALPVFGVGFDTDHVYTGNSFTATLHFASGNDVTEPLNNTLPDGTSTFFGFTSPNGADITGITLLGASASDEGFGLDNFVFTAQAPLEPSFVPLPTSLYMTLLAAPGIALLSLRIRRGIATDGHR